MNELQFGNKVRQVLNQGTQLDQSTLARLRAAREKALARQLISRPVTGLAWADNVMGDFGGFAGFSFRVALPVVVLVAGLAAIYGWQQNLRVKEVAEIDALLLADDLPIDAYLDKGFETWLKKRSPF